MRFLIIRHGDPDYAHDSLTPRGFAEAEALSEVLCHMPIRKIYVSPLGRAQRTAEPTAKKLGLTPEILPWLREFPAGVNPDYASEGIDADPARCPWNMLPQYWTKRPGMYSPADWDKDPLYADGGVMEVIRTIDEGWNALTSEWGYTRRTESSPASNTTHYGQLYDIAEGADESGVIALFCHLGLGNALLARITGGSTPFFWETFFLPPTSVTTLLAQKFSPYDRQCQMRIVGLGDVSHLVRAGLECSSSGLSTNLYDGSHRNT